MHQHISLQMGNRLQQAVQEEIIEIDPHVIVIKRQLCRTRICQCVDLFRLMDALSATGCGAVEKDRPTLLQEGKEDLPVRNDAL